MSLAPEIFTPLTENLVERFQGRHCCKSMSGRGWAALFFRNIDDVLFISWSDPFSGICTSSEAEVSHLFETERRSSLLTDLIRKHVAGYNLSLIERIGNDRIISMTFNRRIGAGFETTRTLIAELTGHRSNLFLLREDGSIMETARPLDNSYIQTSGGNSGRVYCPPRGFGGVDPMCMSEPGLFFSLPCLIGFGKDAGKLLQREWHLYPITSWLQFFRASDNAPSLSEGKTRLLQVFDSKITSFPSPLGKSEILDGETMYHTRNFVVLPFIQERIRSIKRDMLKMAKIRSAKNISVLKGLENLINQTAIAHEYMEKGNLLLSHSKMVPRGSSSVTLKFWKGESLSETVIELDPSRSISQNAQAYFRKYKKFHVPLPDIKNRLEIFHDLERENKLLSETIELADNLEILAPIYNEITSLNSERERKINSSHGKVMIFSLENVRIIAGTNSKSNRKVTFIFASKEDIWFHARGVPGGHVIIKKNPGAEIGEDMITFAASLAAYLSRSAQALKVQVDYTGRKYVRAVPGTISEVTYSHARTVNVSPLLWKRMISEKQPAHGEGATGNS